MAALRLQFVLDEKGHDMGQPHCFFLGIGEACNVNAGADGGLNHGAAAAVANACSNVVIAATVASAARPSPCRAASHAGSL